MEGGRIPFERGTTVAKNVPMGTSWEASQPMAMATARMIAGNMRQSRILKSMTVYSYGICEDRTLCV